MLFLSKKRKRERERERERENISIFFLRASSIKIPSDLYFSIFVVVVFVVFFN